jgi:hypothetical protein
MTGVAAATAVAAAAAFFAAIFAAILAARAFSASWLSAEAAHAARAGAADVDAHADAVPATLVGAAAAEADADAAPPATAAAAAAPPGAGSATGGRLLTAVRAACCSITTCADPLRSTANPAAAFCSCP